MPEGVFMDGFFIQKVKNSFRMAYDKGKRNLYVEITGRI